MNLNRTMVIGYLGADVRKIPSVHGEFLSFSVAATEKYTTKEGEKKEYIAWYSCTYPCSGVEMYLKKGTQVYLEGRVEARPYLTKQGEAKADLALKVSHLQLLSQSKEELLELNENR